MGVSTDGILAFGVDLGEQGEVALPWLDDEVDGDFEEWYAGLHGVSNAHLWVQYEEWAQSPEAAAIPSSSDRVRTYEAEHPDWRDELSAIYARKRELEAECPIEIVRHCSGDYPMLIVAVPGTVTKAARGAPKRVTDLAVDAKKLNGTAAFCHTHEIPFDNPSWLLASMWW